LQKTLKKELKKAADDKDYKVNPSWQTSVEAAIEYLTQSQKSRESKVEELTHALGHEIGKV